MQRRFGQNIINRKRKHEIGILKGILRCKCGYAMGVQHKVDKVYNLVYDNYYCAQRNRKGPEFCDMRMISVDELDQKMIEILKKIYVDKNLLDKYIKNANISLVPVRDKNTIKKEIGNAKKKIDNLTAVLQENFDSSAAKYIISEIEKLDRKIAELNYELREMEHKEIENNKISNDIGTIHAKICKYLDSFDELPYQDKVKYLKEIIKECVWDGQKLNITI